MILHSALWIRLHSSSVLVFFNIRFLYFIQIIRIIDHLCSKNTNAHDAFKHDYFASKSKYSRYRSRNWKYRVGGDGWKHFPEAKWATWTLDPRPLAPPSPDDSAVLRSRRSTFGIGRQVLLTASRYLLLSSEERKEGRGILKQQKCIFWRRFTL